MKPVGRDYERACPRCGGETEVTGNFRICDSCPWWLLKGPDARR